MRPRRWRRPTPGAAAGRGSTLRRRLAACLAELALREGDRFGWAVLAAEGLRVAAPAAGLRQRDRLGIDLHRLTASGGFPRADQLLPLWERIGRRDLVVVLSDLFDEAGVAAAERLAAAGREVLAIQLLTVGERDFPFDGGHRFRDPESGAELIGDGAAMRADFLARFAAAQAALAARLAASGIAHAVHVLDEPLDRPLRALFGGAA